MTKISDLTALTGAGVDTAADLLPIVDMSAAGAARNKKITVAEAKIALGVGPAITELDDVSDVNAATPSNGDVLTWDSTPGEWVASAPSSGIAELDDVPDVNAAAPSNGDVLTWDSTPGEWVAAAPSGGIAELDDVPDVNAPTPSNGDVLTWDSTPGEWVASAPAGGSGGVDVEDEGVAEATGATILNFTGFGVTANDVGGGQVDVAISAGAWELIATSTTTGVGFIDFINLAGYTDLLLMGRAVTGSVSSFRGCLCSVNNGSSFYNTSGDYVQVGGNGVETNAVQIDGINAAASAARSFHYLLSGINVTGAPKVCNPTWGTPTFFVASTSPVNAIRYIHNTGGNITGGTLYLFGRK